MNEPAADITPAAAAAAGIPGVVGSELKAATQELLRAGVVYSTSKPNIYRTLRAHETTVASILAPLDLLARYDDVRGLVYVAVTADAVETTDSSAADLTANTNGDGPGRPVSADEAWSHPLVRRLRLTLEQSLLLAILRRRYTEHEQTVGIGAREPTVVVDELIPELQVYLGASGSESAEEKRVLDLLDQLQRHGIVSTVADDQISIRPLICHVANPSSLQLLLDHYQSLTGGSTRSSRSVRSEHSAQSDQPGSGDDQGPATA